VRGCDADIKLPFRDGRSVLAFINVVWSPWEKLKRPFEYNKGPF
jgi:hypothetical protein